MSDRDQVDAAERVVVDQPETQSLLGLLMRNILADNMADDTKYARVRDLVADIQVQASDMVVTLRFAGGTLTIVKGPSEKPRARVRGGLGAFLRVATGGGVIGPVLAGEIAIGGNPFVLLRLLPLLHVASEPGH
jgi:hypothetical protein